MFKSRKQIMAELAALKEAFATVELRHKELIAAANAMKQRAFLISVERDGKLNKFTFARAGNLYVIETYGTLGDDVAAWKRELLE